MSTRRPYIGTSEAQANADALSRRGSPYGTFSDRSFRINWDANRREPRDLRDAVRMAQRAYADEVPSKLHTGAELAIDGTPRMTATAEGYIFGSAEADDAGRTIEEDGTTRRDLVGYHYTPFRATLSRMARGDASSKRRAAIVSHVTIGSEKPAAAAIKEGAHPLDAKLVAWDALCSFLRSMTDLRLHVPQEDTLSEGATAA